MAASPSNLDLDKSVDESESDSSEFSDSDSYDSPECIERLERLERLKNAPTPKFHMKPRRSGKVIVPMERCKTQDPDLYGYMIGLCKLALKHYQKIHDPTHAQNTFEFVSLDKAFVLYNKGVQYTLTVSAENRIIGKDESFEAVGLVISSDENIKLKIVSVRPAEIGSPS